MVKATDGPPMAKAVPVDSGVALSGLFRILLALPLAAAVALATLSATAMPLVGGLERAMAAKGTVVPASVIIEPLTLPGGENPAELEGPSLDNVPEPDTLAILGGAIAAFALVALIRRRRGK